MSERNKTPKNEASGITTDRFMMPLMLAYAEAARPRDLRILQEAIQDHAKTQGYTDEDILKGVMHIKKHIKSASLYWPSHVPRHEVDAEQFVQSLYNSVYVRDDGAVIEHTPKQF